MSGVRMQNSLESPLPVRLSLPCLELTQGIQDCITGDGVRYTTWVKLGGPTQRTLRDLILDVEVLPGEAGPGWGGKGGQPAEGRQAGEEE